MASVTGIEFKPDSCVLAGVRASRGGIDVFAVHAIGRAAWPSQDVALTETLRTARRQKRLPRRAHVVVWGIPEGGAVDESATVARLQPFTAAGFRIQSVLTPPQALTALAASRRRESRTGAVAWLALNMHGAAIAIVRGSDLLYSRTFDWLYTPGAAGSTAQLLQRYTLVAHIAPELRHALVTVRVSHGVAVESAVTCGDLPDLRSLTMPLIEEMDLEFETLDSTDGLRAIGVARQERFAEQAPSIRLATAAASSNVARHRQPSVPSSFAGVAAAATIVTVLGGIGFVYWSAQGDQGRTAGSTKAVAPPSSAASSQPGPDRPVPQRETPTRPVPAPATSGAQPVTKPASPVQSTPIARPPLPQPVEPAPTPPPVVTPPASRTPPPSIIPPPGIVAASPPAPIATRPSTPAQQRSESPGEGRATRGMTAGTSPPARASTPPPVPGRGVTPAAAAPPPPPVASAAPVLSAAQVASGVPAAPVARPPVPTVPFTATAPSAVPPTERVPRPAPVVRPLADPLPKVDSILIDRERRLTIVNGSILGVGDTIGRRTVVQIERDAVILREPSGLEIRVRLRSGLDP